MRILFGLKLLYGLTGNSLEALWFRLVVAKVSRGGEIVA